MMRGRLFPALSDWWRWCEDRTRLAGTGGERQGESRGSEFHKMHGAMFHERSVRIFAAQWGGNLAVSPSAC